MKKLSIFDELYNSYYECLKRKTNTTNAMNFMLEKEKNLINLKRELVNKEYIPGKSVYFLVSDPKVREVFAADFKDRVIHHFFVRSIEKNFYADMSSSVYSCIKGRGTHKCIDDVKKIYKNYKYYLQVDIKSFFMSINKEILKEKVRKYLPKNSMEHISNKYYQKIDFDLEIYSYLLDVLLDFDPTTNCSFRRKDYKNVVYDKDVGYVVPNSHSILPLRGRGGSNFPSLREGIKGRVKDIECKDYGHFVDSATSAEGHNLIGQKIILPKHKSLFGCEKGVGMPIGNYTSQFFANVYLNDLDKYITNDLGIKDYFRYVDDLVLFGNDFLELKSMISKIQNYLETSLKQTLATSKTKIKQTAHGLDFLGYFVKPNVTYTRKRVKNNFVKKLKELEGEVIKKFPERSRKEQCHSEFSSESLTTHGTFAGNIIKDAEINSAGQCCGYFIDSASSAEGRHTDIDKMLKIVSLQKPHIEKLRSVCASYLGHFSHASAKHLQKKIFYRYSFLQYYLSNSWSVRGALKDKRMRDKEKKVKNVYRIPGMVAEDIKKKKRDNKNVRLELLKSYDNAFPNTSIFFPLNIIDAKRVALEMQTFKHIYYYIFRKKDLLLLENIPKELLGSLGVKIYENIGFKVRNVEAKEFLKAVLKYTDRNILLLEGDMEKMRTKYLYLNSG